MEVEVEIREGGRGARSSARAERMAGRDGAGGGGFDGVAAWLMALPGKRGAAEEDEHLFRKILLFL